MLFYFGCGTSEGEGEAAGDSPCAPCPATRIEKPYTLRDTLRDTLRAMLRAAHALSRRLAVCPVPGYTLREALHA